MSEQIPQDPERQEDGGVEGAIRDLDVPDAHADDESIQDLDVADGSDVVGGSVAITTKPTGEKQGGPK